MYIYYHSTRVSSNPLVVNAKSSHIGGEPREQESTLQIEICTQILTRVRCSILRTHHEG
jgi:hypothetical protein